MNCFNLIVSGGAGVGKRVDQSQNTSLQSYKFEKWEDFFVVGNFSSFVGEFDTSKPKLDDVLGVIYRFYNHLRSVPC